MRRQLGRHPHDRLASGEQIGFETSRQNRPAALRPELLGATQQGEVIAGCADGSLAEPAGDALVLANVLRTDRSAHRPIPADSELVRAVRGLARAQQDAVWERQQAQNKLRSLLRVYYASALATFDDLDAPVAREVLTVAPTPDRARRLRRTTLRAAVIRAGRQRGIDAEVERILSPRAAAATPVGRTRDGSASPRPPARTQLRRMPTQPTTSAVRGGASQESGLTRFRRPDGRWKNGCWCQQIDDEICYLTPARNSDGAKRCVNK